MKNVIITSVLALMLATGANAKNIYVSPDGSTSNNGNSWDSPISDLGTAYSKASKGDVILMAAGTYTVTATINMIEGVHVYGGFAKGETSIENRVRPNAATEPWKFTNETIITSGNQTFRLVDRVDKDTFWENTIIDGITFKNNVSTDSRVLYLRNSVTLQNCQILDNGCTGTVVYGEENTMVRDCYFSGNKTSDSSKEPVTLQLRGCHYKYYPGNEAHNCVFEGNLITSISIYNTNEKVGEVEMQQESDKDGTLVDGCTFRNNKAACVTINNQWDKRYLKIMNCLFEGNTASNDGVVFSGNTTAPCDFAFNVVRNNVNLAPTTDTKFWRYGIISARKNTRLSNSLFVNNSSDNLLFDLQGSTYLFNSTVSNNKGTVYVDAYSTATNSIIANNTPTHKDVLVYASNSYVEYCASNEELQMGDGAEYSDNIIESNYFVAPTTFIGADETQIDAIRNADFSLVASSSCINAGTVDYYKDMYGMTDEWMAEFMSKDVAGNERIVAGKINMGAYQGGKGTGVNNVEKGVSCNVIVDSDAIYVSSEEDGYAVVYNVNGTLIASENIIGGNAVITLTQGGFYLVKVVVGNQAKTFKVAVK